jgi:hypothetical protein
MSDNPLARYSMRNAEEVFIDLDAAGLRDQHGNLITEASLEAKSVEMDKRSAGLTPGGKSLSGDGSHSPQFKVTLGTHTAREVKRRAEAERMSVSKWMRKLIEEKLAA